MDLGNQNALGTATAGAGVAAAAAAQPASSQSLPAAAPAVDQPTYTFIDHDDDPCSKKIKNSRSRKAIRSHVMRDVRRRERLAGFKRGSKRDAEDLRPQSELAAASRPEVTVASKPELPVASRPEVDFVSRPEPPVAYTLQPPVTYRPEFAVAPRPVEDSTDRNSASSSVSPAALSNSSSSTEEIETTDGDVVMAQPTWQHTVAWTTTDSSFEIGTSSLTATQSKLAPDLETWTPDPQRPMKSADCIPTVVSELIYYWRNVFVPQTFPNGHDAMQESGMGLMIRSVFTDVGCFFAFMSICAAHRAIISGRVIEAQNDEDALWIMKDKDYHLLKHRSIMELNRKMKDPNEKITNETLETVVSLLTGSIIAGLFGEVRVHLQGLKELVELRGGYSSKNISCGAMLAAVFTVDVKAASGLMTKPVFPLTWGLNPTPNRAFERSRPNPKTQLSKFGAALYANPLISAPLRRTLHRLYEAACYSENTNVHNVKPRPEEHAFFRLVTCEVEHQLLSYPFVNNHPPLHPIEAVVRVCTICYINYFLIVSPPSSGLGRALTKHTVKAITDCFQVLQPMRIENYHLIIWALFVGSQGSVGQIEHPWFLANLSRLMIICGWYTWEKSYSHLIRYIYIPHVHHAGTDWRDLWYEVMCSFFPRNALLL